MPSGQAPPARREAGRIPGRKKEEQAGRSRKPPARAGSSQAYPKGARTARIPRRGLGRCPKLTPGPHGIWAQCEHSAGSKPCSKSDLNINPNFKGISGLYYQRNTSIRRTIWFPSRIPRAGNSFALSYMRQADCTWWVDAPRRRTANPVARSLGCVRIRPTTTEV